jgi:hypothetical protein
MFKCDKNQMPYCNVQNFKKWKFWEFGPLIKHGPYWINFIVFTFISEKIDTLDAHIKFGANLFHLTWEEIGKSKTNNRFYGKKRWIWGVLGMSPYVSNEVHQPYLDPRT